MSTGDKVTEVFSSAFVVNEPDKVSLFTNPRDVNDPEPASLATV